MTRNEGNAAGMNKETADRTAMNRKNVNKICVFCLAAVMLLCGFAKAPEYAAGNGRIKGTMYFGHEWQINFWTCEHAEAPEDFARLAEDGFNTVIFVVPWRAFQPYLQAGGFNEKMFAKLDELMEEAAQAGLGVMLRVGYTWDMAEGDSALNRFNALVSDKTARSAWLSYAARVYQSASAHPNFVGAFLTWEDFWNYLDQVERYALENNYEQAKLSGFVNYVLSHYEPEELEELYDNERDAMTAPFPRKYSPAYRLVLEWYDEFLNELLLDTQEVFPGISMECRLHNDPYQDPDGRLLGYNHAATYGAGNADYTSAMLSVDMGATAGTSAASVAEQQAVLLSGMAAAAGKPVFVDQFIYDEDTPGYEDQPHISDDINEYLRRMGSIFRNRTMGYSLWNVRDYADNVIYNPEFGLGLEGWSGHGGVSIEELDGNHMAKLAAGAGILQSMSQRAYLSNKPTRVRMRVIAEKDSMITVTVGGQSESRKAEAGDHVLAIDFAQNTGGSVSITSAEEVLIDDIKVFSHITESGIYDLDGNPGPYMSGLHALNGAM